MLGLSLFGLGFFVAIGGVMIWNPNGKDGEQNSAGLAVALIGVGMMATICF